MGKPFSAIIEWLLAFSLRAGECGGDVLSDERKMGLRVTRGPQGTAHPNPLRAALCFLFPALIAACGQNPPGDPDRAATGISRTAPNERSTPERQRGQLTDSDLQNFRDFISGSEMRKASQPTQNPFFERFHTDGRWEAQYAWTDITECAGTWSARLKDEELLQICVAVAECSGRELRQGFEECRTAAPDYGNARMEIAPLGQEAFLEGESPTVSVNPID